ncbi:cytochrome P450 [Cyathus striatus]|nr:cytochrome P450 [Cyathus striatus]
MSKMLFVYLIFLYAIHKILEYYALTKSIRNSKRFGQFLSHTGHFAEFLNGILGIFPDRIHIFHNKYSKFMEVGQDIYAVTSVWPQAVLNFNIADAAVIRNVVTSRVLFPKPAHNYQIIAFLGRNIIASEGDEWKRFRRVCAPAFTMRNNRMVWDETENVIMDIFENLWGNEKQVILENALDITLPISLYVISAVGFGKKELWHRPDHNEVPSGHQMSFKDSIRIIANNMYLRAALPTWVLNIGPTERIRSLRDAIKELKQHLFEVIEDRKKIGKGEMHDLLSNLVEATFGEAGSHPCEMTEEELIGNIFAFLVAGHETTMHSIAFTFALLALYPDVQEKLYQELKTVCDGRTPTYDDIPRLKVYNETLRMIPPVPAIPKYTTEHTTFKVGNIHGNTQEIDVPKNSSIIISVAGVHYNPKYWDEPEKFNPERFLDNWPRYAFMPFSGGARICLGQKFAETEVLAVLSFICSKYQISLRDDTLYVGETFEEKKTRALKMFVGLPVGVPLVFRQRD